jgi:predicted TPR repeat methyltransferase
MDDQTGEQALSLAARFDAVYKRNRDPWGLESRFYEHRKRLLSIVSLPKQHYGRAFEIGCSIGVMTEEIAPLADDLLAADVSERAVQEARMRLQPLRHVRVERREVPREWPRGRFDLITVSEVGFFMGTAGLQETARLTAENLTDDGNVLLCHWRHPMKGWELDGDDVHRIFIAHSGLKVVCDHLEADFRLNILAKEEHNSVGGEHTEVDPPSSPPSR